MLDYPKEKLEVILVDDHSDDGTAEFVEEFALRNRIPLQVYLLPVGQTGKKAAIAMAREKATCDFLFFTDADVQLPSGWLLKMLVCQQNTQAGMVCSEVAVKDNGSLISKIESLEQAALVAISAARLASGHPFLCNGAGYLVTRNAILELQWPPQWGLVPGGDDVLLLHAIDASGQNTAYCRIAETRVLVDPAGTLGEFTRQRIRWGSKVFLRKAGGNLLPAVLIWLFHSLFLGLVCLLVATGNSIALMAMPGILLLRALPEALLVSTFLSRNNPDDFPNDRSGIFRLTIWISLLSPLYSLYVLLAGPVIISTRRFNWKGRVYSS